MKQSFVMWMIAGALGDVDGDGLLDLVSISSFTALIRDKHGHFVRAEKRARVSKHNLELAMAHANEQRFHQDSINKSNRTNKVFDRLRPLSMQPWAAYLGTCGDSVYSAD
jgi:hypothetical protein